ncbi:hypothetical protein XELAEV_18009265mg [Xenopus laevis]|uniref:Uncharacterized protein n=1 Tax=Xenopus laevis TaxID=8355 RepID=A0A974DS73_XENLA|nr:hypothetical protein XELAEV_18009265mg [Xenopus laevis]
MNPNSKSCIQVNNSLLMHCDETLYNTNLILQDCKRAQDRVLHRVGYLRNTRHLAGLWAENLNRTLMLVCNSLAGTALTQPHRHRESFCAQCTQFKPLLHFILFPFKMSFFKCNCLAIVIFEIPPVGGAADRHPRGCG